MQGTFHLQVSGGLASRLRVVLGGIAFCEATNRQLHLDWPLIERSEDSAEFPVKFHDIWQHELWETNGTVYWTGTEAKTMERGVDARLRTCHIEPFLPYFRKPIRSYFNKLSPQVYVTRIVEGALPTIKDGPCVGVNIRHHLKAPQTVAAAWFWDRMEAIYQTYSDVRFYLSTDDAQISAATKRQFGNIIERPQTFRYDVDGIRGRAADLYLLDACDWVLGSNHSSYSQLVALLGGAEYVGPHNKPSGLQGGRYEDAWNPAEPSFGERDANR